MKKMLYSIIIITILSVCFIKNFVYANAVIPQEEIYTPLYFIAIIIVIAIVVGISILILKKIYKSNQLEEEKGVENNDKS